MSNIKACIFDLDGTLTNTINAIAHFGNIALAAFGLPEIPVEDYKIYVGDGFTPSFFVISSAVKGLGFVGIPSITPCTASK